MAEEASLRSCIRSPKLRFVYYLLASARCTLVAHPHYATWWRREHRCTRVTFTRRIGWL